MAFFAFLLAFLACRRVDPPAAGGGSGAAAIRLVPVATGFNQPTDVQFPPGESDRAVILEKGGDAWLLSGEGLGQRSQILDLDVLTASEQGLLGLAFHPRFAENGRFVIHTSVKVEGEKTSEISLWRVDPKSPAWKPQKERVLLRVAQPYANHNGGQVLFGPDGYLYIAFGDGGSAGDPHGHGQDGGTLLGSLLRIDADRGDPYAVPPDNPFVGEAGFKPEIWAYGLRNPWRFDFLADGRVITGDVGQNKHEEIDVIAAGDNLGWSRREGRHCFKPAQNCGTAGFVDPIFEYGRDQGASVTGGVVVTAPGALQGKYLFADFATGRMWALTPPRAVQPAPAQVLGQFSINPVAFGRDGQGRAYVAGYGDGVIYRIDAG